MRKNSKNLISALIAIIAILTVVVVFGPKTKDNLNLNLELGEGKQLVYETGLLDNEKVESIAQVLKKRITNFGAIEVQYSIEGSQITLTYTGIEDNDTLRKYLPMIGKVSFRDYDGKELMGREVLNETMPFGIATKDDSTLLYIFVGDSKTFQANTLVLSMADKKYLVVWVDYDGVATFEDEQSKTNPAFLAAATVSSAISDTCYITSAHDYDTTKSIVAMVNGGELISSINEVSFNDVASTTSNGANLIIMGIWSIVALAAVVLIAKYRLAGAVSSLMLLIYVVASIATISAFGVIFDSVVVTLIIFALFIGIFYLFNINKKFNDQLNSGLLLDTCLKNTYQKSLASAIEAHVGVIVGATICYIFLKSYFAGFAITLLTLSIYSLVFFVLWNKFMLTDLVKSRYFDNKTLGYKEKVVEEKTIDFAKLAKTKFTSLLFAAFAIFTILFIAQEKSNIKTLLYSIIPLVIAMIFTVGYYSYKNKKAVTKGFFFGSIYALLASYTCIYLAKLTGKENIGFALTFISLMMILVILTIKQYSDTYDQMSKSKLNESKIETLFNEVSSSIYANLVVSVLAVLIFVAITVVLRLYSMTLLNVLLLIVGAVMTIYVSASIWLQYTLNNYRKPKGNPKRSSEKKERVIFGIND